jgi:hypothetical protein
VKSGIDRWMDRATPQQSGVSTKIQAMMNRSRCMAFESQD